MRSEVELLIDCRNDLGETPVWCARTQTLFWIDVTPPGRVFYCDSRRGAADFYEFNDLVTGLALRAQGGLLVVGARDIYEFEWTNQTRRKIFSLPADEAEHRFNDGACDRAGRLWIGSMQNNLSEKVRAVGRLESSGRIYCISRDGSARSFEAQLGCPNAMCWSLDNATFYVADSVTGWIYAYDFDLAAGKIDGRREFCRFADLGVPDGATVDCEGYIWNARWGAGVVARISPAGTLDRIVKVPATNPTACCFGGTNMDTLYVTSARYGLNPAQLAAEPYAGGVFAIRSGVPGNEKSAFGG
jgi:sugar lactone lactonase YvrE